ncbi:MAG: universal stress protein [Bacteroidota bacterium]
MKGIILVPVDFSLNSVLALDYAAALARKSRSPILLLHAVYAGPLNGLLTPAAAREESRRKLKELEQRAREAKVKCGSVLKTGLAVNAILERARKKDIGLIIMGTKGASGIKGALLGSVTAAVIGRASCPVIAVPERYIFRDIRHIVYASDYRSSDTEALAALSDMAGLMGAEITVIHVPDGETDEYIEKLHLEDFEKEIREKVGSRQISFRLRYGPNTGNALEKTIRYRHPQLLAMSTRHRTFLEKLFRPSLARSISLRTPIPLMVFHHKKESLVFI